MAGRTQRLIETTVVGLGHDGRGVARHAGKTVFVAGALPGERVRCRIVRARARHDEGELLEILEPSPERRTPPCPHYGKCGGCALQHLAPAAQLAARQQQLADALGRIARLTPGRWLDPVASEPWQYRSRARLAIEAGAHGVALGLRREGSHRVEPLAECGVLVGALGELLAPLASELGAHERPGQWQEAWIAQGEPGIALGMVARQSPPHPPDLARLREFCAARGLGLQTGTASGAATHWDEPLAWLDYHCGPDHTTLQFHPGQFTQANRAVNRELVTRVAELLEPEPADRLLDLYCGIGNFALPLARRVASVTGVEGDPRLVESARGNAQRNGIDNAAFLRADLAREPLHGGWSTARHDLVILDPPRAGAAALVPALARLGARRMCYISCDAATLARDAQAICAERGWKLLAAGVLDMFPQTAHFESLALFGR